MEMNLLDHKKEYESLLNKKNLKGQEALTAVTRDGLHLKYVQEQTPELCLAAVKQNNYALQFVNDKLLKIHTIEIDGETIELSEESFNNLREQFAK